MSVAEAVTIKEFKRRDDGFNEQIKGLERRMEEQKSRHSVEQLKQIHNALEEELSLQNGVRSELASAVLNHIVMKQGGTKEEPRLDIHLKFGGPFVVVFDRRASPFCFDRSK